MRNPLNHPHNHYAHAVEPGFHGRNFRAVVFHPKFKGGRQEFFAYSEQEARRQAWKFALQENAAGFVIRAQRKSLMP